MHGLSGSKRSGISPGRASFAARSGRLWNRFEGALYLRSRASSRYRLAVGGCNDWL
jgi:hypothetical protein